MKVASKFMLKKLNGSPFLAYSQKPFPFYTHVNSMEPPNNTIRPYCIVLWYHHAHSKIDNRNVSA